MLNFYSHRLFARELRIGMIRLIKTGLVNCIYVNTGLTEGEKKNRKKVSQIVRQTVILICDPKFWEALSYKEFDQSQSLNSSDSNKTNYGGLSRLLVSTQSQPAKKRTLEPFQQLTPRVYQELIKLDQFPKFTKI